MSSLDTFLSHDLGIVLTGNMKELPLNKKVATLDIRSEFKTTRMSGEPFSKALQICTGISYYAGVTPHNCYLLACELLFKLRL